MDKIKRIEDLFAWLNEIEQKRIVLQEKTGIEFVVFFRGVNNRDFEDIPAIYRNAGLSHNEFSVYSDCLRLSASDFAAGERVFERLAKMQHYNVPTRLLDATTNPLVALFFSQFNGQEGKTGRISVFFASKEAVVNYDSPIVTILSNLSRVNLLCSDDINPSKIDSALKRVIYQSEVTEDYDYFQDIEDEFNNDTTQNNRLLLDKIHEDDPSIHKISRWDINSVVCVMPRQNNARIKQQNGIFILPGIYRPGDVMNTFSMQCLNNLIPIISFLNYKNLHKMDDGENTFDKVIHILKEVLGFKKQAIDHLVKLNEMFTARTNISSNESAIIDIAFLTSDHCSNVIKRRMATFIKIVSELMIRKKKTTYWIKRLSNNPIYKGDFAVALSPTTTQEELLPLLMLFQLLSDEPRLIIKDFISVEINEELKKKLNVLGVTEDFLFPELDHVGHSIREKYCDKNLDSH